MKALLPASIPRRILATIVDIALISLAVLPIVILLDGGHLLSFAFFLVASCAYYAKCSHQSLGQKIARIRVAMSAPKMITARVIFNRTLSQFLCPAIELLLLQIVSMFDGVYVTSLALFLHIITTLFWIFWYLMGLFSPTASTMHDLLFGTTVVVAYPSRASE